MCRDADEQVLPSRLIVETAAPEADMLQLARDLVAAAPRYDGRCVFCWEPEHRVHIDDCLLARARRHLALLELQREQHPVGARRIRRLPH